MRDVCGILGCPANWAMARPNPIYSSILKNVRYWILHWILSGVALFFVAHILPGIEVDSLGAALIAALVIGLVSATVGGDSQNPAAAVHHSHIGHRLFPDQWADVEAGVSNGSGVSCRRVSPSRPWLDPADDCGLRSEPARRAVSGKEEPC